ncbi:MAG: hypothetical protein GY752_01745 [bacterium]|nr:hypothetical protein [bacterium]MCP4798562.1 hypothetical protein [bacterium]
MKIKLLLCLVLLVSGCGDSTVTPDPGPEPIEYPFPDTKEQLLANFKIAYQEMDIDGYRECLSENFKFIFTVEDQAQYGLPNQFIERAEDLEIMTRTFSGDSYETPYGTQPGLQSITISNWSSTGIWQQESANHPYFPESYLALYDIYLVYSEVGGEHTLTVDTNQLFYVESVEELQDDGTYRTRWYLVGQEDLGFLRKNDSVSWGELKALFM